MGKLHLILVVLATAAVGILAMPKCAAKEDINYNPYYCKADGTCDLGKGLDHPKEAYKITVRAFYDDSFKTEYGNEASGKIDGILNFVVFAFYDFSYSLGYKFTLKVEDVKTHVAGSYPSTDDGSERFSNHLRGLSDDGSLGTANVNLMFSVSSDGRMKEHEGSEAGSVCDADLSRRLILVEDIKENEFAAGRLIAHGIGHMLGLKHDDEFDTVVDKQRCDKINGFMRQVVGRDDILADGWSRCSKRDIEKNKSDVWNCLEQDECTNLMYRDHCTDKRLAELCPYIAVCNVTCGSCNEDL